MFSTIVLVVMLTILQILYSTCVQAVLGGSGAMQFREIVANNFYSCQITSNFDL